MGLKRLLEKIFFNPLWKCAACGNEKFNDGYLCESCMHKLPYITVCCNHCGRKLKSPALYCDECKNVQLAFNRAVSVFEYGGDIARLIKRFKYDGEKYLCDFFADEMYLKAVKEDIKADIITYIPMSKKEYKKRGFNQAQLLAESFAAHYGTTAQAVLVKIRETARQAELGFNDRLKNLKGVFKVASGNEIKGKNILVIDDVLTTGATSISAAEVLKAGGAKSVTMLEIASVTGNKE